MKKIFLFISVLVSVTALSQSLPTIPGYTNLNSKNQWQGVKPPPDTTYSKYGFASKGDSVYWGNGTFFRLLSVGGTGSPFVNPMTTLGDIIRGGVAGVPTRMAGNLTAIRQVYTSTGTGSAAQAPALIDATVYTPNGELAGDAITAIGNGRDFTNTHTTQTFTDGVVPGQCPVTWTGTGLVFNVGTPCNYTIAGIPYSFPGGNVTLAAADPADPRQDAIVVTTSTTATSVAGTPQTNPEVPTVSATELFLTSVFVDAGATTPTQVGQTIVRDEGSGGEWTIIKTMVSTDNYATNPFHGTISQRITTAGNNSYMMWDGPTVSKSSYNTLLLYIRNNSALNNARTLTVRLFNGAVQVGNALPLTTYGYVRGTLASYQTIAIPMSAFAGADAFNRIRITNTGTGGTVDFQIDYVQLQSGIITPAPSAKQVFFSSVASLRAYTGTTDIQAVTQGYYAANDGGGAAYYWDGTSTTADDGGLVIKATAIATGRWKLIFDRWVNVLWFGAKGDNSTDDRAKFVQALAALPQVTIASGQTSRGTLYAPFRTYYLSDSLLISDQINFIGGSLAAGLFGTTRMEFASGKSGVILQMGNPSGGSRGSAMRNFYLYCRGGSDTTRHGLRFNGVSDIEYVTAENFGGNGIYANTTVDGNNSGSYIGNCKALNNGLDGIRLDGGETSAVFVLNPITQTNGRINIHDNGFLGSEIYGGQAAIAGQRPGFTSDSWASSGGRYYVCKRNHTNKQPNVASDWTDYWEDMGTTTEIPASVAAWSGATPYKIAANYASTGAAQAAKVDGLYRETGSGSDVISSATSMNIGGVQASMFKHIGPSLTARDGYFDVNSGAGLQVRDTLNPDFYSRLTTEFGFEVGNKSTADESLAYKIQLKAFSDSTIKLFSGNVLVAKQLWTGRPLIGTKYGRTGNVEAGIPIFTKRGLFFQDIVGPADYTSSTRIRMFAAGSSYPLAEGINYGVGDIIINNNLPANDTLLWFCNTATPGGIWADWTPLLKSGGGGGGSGWALTGTSTLTGDATIDVGSHDLSFTGSNSRGFTFSNDGSVNYTGLVGTLNFNVGDDANTFTDNTTSQAGLQYGAHPGSPTAFTLVDKAYVDAAVAGGGGISGSGASTRNAYWTGAGSLGSSSAWTFDGTDILSLSGTDIRSNSGNWLRISATGATTQFFKSGATSLIDIYDGAGSNTLHFDYNHITASSALTVNFFNSNIHTTGSGASTELVATDGGGNNTTISPHTQGLLNYKLKKLGWTFNSIDKDGNQITVDELKARETIETLSKEVEELKLQVALLMGKKYEKKKPVKIIYKKLVK